MHLNNIINLFVLIIFVYIIVYIYIPNTQCGIFENFQMVNFSPIKKSDDRCLLTDNNSRVGGHEIDNFAHGKWEREYDFPTDVLSEKNSYFDSLKRGYNKYDNSINENIQSKIDNDNTIEANDVDDLFKNPNKYKGKTIQEIYDEQVRPKFKEVNFPKKTPLASNYVSANFGNQF